MAYLTINLQNLFLKRKILSKALKSHMVYYIVINNFFVSFEIIGGSQNTLSLINEFEKCILSFMESLIADFIQFSSTIAKFYFCKGDQALDYVCTQFRDFIKISSFSKLFDHSSGNSDIQFLVIMV